ncbi:MAG: cytochrome oxidase assembly protein [Microbacterium sp. SCN 70-27]|uniref:COX15/CtaA family protein n=1 Tax=unclassified Microbacterium TaxID=2609290 RepID=UPI000868F99B|nr:MULTISPECIES: COX15/CtaA family protein [unclassified Microbacterium]MBN9224957.1 heme A synthase [Microbacterium sp.]ODT28024.1 MAG: cytochrome oxidase assembly protein [Microbacterium sp. SCN 70-27]
MSDAPTSVASHPSIASTLLPDRITRYTRVLAWLVLITNIVIVATGGLVRLTGSGMGCETWPYCTEGSLVPTAPLGVHGLIEFGNRTLTGVLVVVALLAFLSVVRLWKTRPELPRLTLAVGIGIILQAVVGGVIVWLHLPPSLVGIHFFISAALVALGAAYVVRVYAAPGPRRLGVPTRYAILVHVTSAVLVVTVSIGILLTGSGPHAGDDEAARNGLDPIFWQHVHSWPAYVLFALSVLIFVGSLRMPKILRLPLWTGLLLAVELVQIVIGLWQARTGLPIALVNIHMVLAVCLVAAMTAVVLYLKAPLAVLTTDGGSTAGS